MQVKIDAGTEFVIGSQDKKRTAEDVVVYGPETKLPDDMSALNVPKGAPKEISLSISWTFTPEIRLGEKGSSEKKVFGDLTLLRIADTTEALNSNASVEVIFDDRSLREIVREKVTGCRVTKWQFRWGGYDDAGNHMDEVVESLELAGSGIEKTVVLAGKTVKATVLAGPGNNKKSKGTKRRTKRKRN